MYRLLFLVYILVHDANCELCVLNGCSSGQVNPNPSVYINLGVSGQAAQPPLPVAGGVSASAAPVQPVATHSATGKQNKQLENLGHKVIAFDKLLAGHCIKNSNEVFEVYGKDGYTLEYKLVDKFKAEDIEVKIKHRVMHVKGFDHQQGVLSDIRVLADTLDVALASWMLTGDVLQVTIPYKTKLEEKCRKLCNNVFSNKTLMVSSYDGDLSTFYRIGRVY